MHTRLYNYLYWLQAALVALVLLGILPRETMFFVAAAVIVFIIKYPLEDGAAFFVQSIPLFLALPITESFDNFNEWRIVLVVLFAKWLSTNWRQISIPHRRKSWQHFAWEALLVLALLSLINAPEVTTGIRRIIYLINASLIGVITYDLIRKNREFATRLINAIRVPVMIVIAVGFLQVISTYLMDVYQFMHLWGEGIQCNEFGTAWCYIAVNLGNTWLAYYGEQLSLRVFSLFPDSHSFPLFVLLGIPALFTYGISNITKVTENFESLKRLFRTHGRFIILWVPAAFLIVILSGTRGIWAASIGVVCVAALAQYLFKKFQVSHIHAVLFRYTTSYLLLFFLLFAVAYPIFVSPQFLVSKGNFDLLGSRIRSIIDFGETSNSLRIEIWKKTLESIQEKPLLGVGIGNYPVVLGQDIRLARAGSSAHNIYLHIAAEIGIPALLLAMSLVIFIFVRLYRAYTNNYHPIQTPYVGAMILCLPWVLIYSLTDVALLDERALLLFTATISMVTALGHD